MKKQSVFTGIVIIILGVIAVASMIAYGYFSHENTSVYFNPAKKTAAKKLYDSVMEIDFENNYPKTPEEVMTFYLEISKLIYSDMIRDKSLYSDIVLKMRHVFGPELRDNNTLETQVDTVVQAVELLEENSAVQTDYEQLPAIHSPVESGVCYIKVNQTYSTGEIFYWEFRLERMMPDREWKITRFEMTDENYTKEKDGTKN